jgi:alcohol dehydrogenase
VNLIQVIKEMSNGGVDYSFECVGNAQVVETAFLSCHNVCWHNGISQYIIFEISSSGLMIITRYNFQGWGLTIICGVAGEKAPFSAHPGLFLYGRSLVGTLFGGLKPKSDMPKMVDMYMQKVRSSNLDFMSPTLKCYTLSCSV